jgi:ribose-phosphate pyrophosphokinase
MTGLSGGTVLAAMSAMTLTVIAGSANVPLAASISAALGVKLCGRVIQRFADGELHVDIDESIRGHDVYVIEPTSLPVDEHVMELLFLADACRRAGAARLTAVVPYFGYARQDRRTSGREAVGARVVADLIEGAGFARVVAIDLHAPAIEGFFHIPLEHLSAAKLLAEAVRTTTDTVIVAPDLGAVKLAERYQALLHVPVVVLHKRRVSGSEVSLRSIIGDVKDRAPLIVDDMITTGATIEAAVKGLLEAGCKPDVSVVATHALFVGPAIARIRALPIRQLIGTNSVELESALPAHFQVVNVASMIADTITRLHRGESLEHLLARA